MMHKLIKILTVLIIPISGYLFISSAFANEMEQPKISLDMKIIQAYLKFNSDESIAPSLESLNQTEREQLLKRIVREEALYREAIALKLDQNDPIIRRRLVQKMEAITLRASKDMTGLSDDALSAYYGNNKADYYTAPKVTFTHVFYDVDKHSPEQAKALAETKFIELNKKVVKFSQATEHGDRFPFQTNFVEKQMDYVSSYFGQSMSDTIFSTKADDALWIGPLQSSYGYHLVKVTKQIKGFHMPFKDVASEVRYAAMREQQLMRKKQLTAEIVTRYQIDFSAEVLKISDKDKK